MRVIRSLTSALFILLFIPSWCQQTAELDSLPKSDSLSRWQERWNQQPHSTLKATMYSVACPGLGQWYNGRAKSGSLVKRYWKVPLVYAALGTSVGFIAYNAKQYKAYRSSYIALADTDPATQPDMNLSIAELDFYQDAYHKRMDVSYLAFIGVYLLQVIDANVDAHLFYFDVSRDLSLHCRPDMLSYGNTIQPGLSLGLTIRSKHQTTRFN